MNTKRRSKIQSDQHPERRKDNVILSNEKMKSPRVNCHKKSVFTKDSIKYIYKNYHDLSSSTVNTIVDSYMYPHDHNYQKQHYEPDPIKDHLREKLTKDAYNYEYAQYMQPYLEATESCNQCNDPMYSDIYSNYQPYFDYYGCCPEVYCHQSCPFSSTEDKPKKRPKTSRRERRRPVYHTDTSQDMMREKKSKTKKSVLSCGNQTDFCRRSSNVATQTDQIEDERGMNVCDMCSKWNSGDRSFFSFFGHYSQYIFLATLSINLLRVYQRL